MRKYLISALKKVCSEDIEVATISFLKNKEPTKDEIHEFAKSKNLDLLSLETILGKIAHKSLTGKYLKHGNDPDDNFDEQLLLEGIDVEMEHTGDVEIAKAIAKAHLTEDLDYYKKLKKVEDTK